MHLVGDIGGTRSRLAFSSPQGLLHVRVFANADFPDFATLLGQFLTETDIRPLGGCFAVAGPVADDGRSVHLTNLGWRIELAALEAHYSLPRLRLVNDFAGAAMGITVTPPSALVTLQLGQPLAEGLRLVIGAGTGLGVASLFKGDSRWHVLPGEGGHVGFAPQDEQQDALCHWLRERHPRVIAEHVVSGSGLASIHAFLCEQRGVANTAATPAAVATRAQAGDVIALDAFDLFAAVYGAVAGDYALARMARGGVFLAGGIAAANLGLMQRGPFMAAFSRKGVYTELIGQMPVHVVTDPLLGLHGAACFVD